MPPPESDSSIPLPGVAQRSFRSSPPPFVTAEEMESGTPHKPEPAGPNQEAEKRPPITQADSGETERPASAQRVNADVAEQLTTDEEEEPEEEEADPADEIDDFDWDELHQRYHLAIDTASQEEAELMQEWTQLMEYFKIWAEAGHSHETDRTFSRLRTRMAYVQNSEHDLERTRNHYVSVVKAFESALNLLRNAGFRD